MFGKKSESMVKGDAITYIGTGVKIEGKLRCTGSIKVDGEIHGDIDCQSQVSIGPSAYIVATIHAATVTVNGRIEGNIFTSDQLEVLSAGHIAGNVSNPPGKLITHEGAIIEGQCYTYESSKKLNQVTEKSTKEPQSIPFQDKKLIDNPQGKVAT